MCLYVCLYVCVRHDVQTTMIAGTSSDHMDTGNRAISILQDEVDEVDDLDKEHARPRKRTRRACDKCSSSRTRCNGELPW